MSDLVQDLTDAHRGLVILEVEKNSKGDKIKTTLQMVGNRQGDYSDGDASVRRVNRLS